MRQHPMAVTLVLAFALVCAWSGARGLVEFDAIGLALAIDQQDIRIHHPPPPGFVLYLWFASFLDAWIDDPWLALRVVAIVALGATALFTAGVARLLVGASAARLALIAFVSSPLVLYSGMTATSFPAAAFISAGTGFLCLRALGRRASKLRFESYLLGLAIGLRAHAIVVALPLWIWTLVHLRLTRRERVMAVVAWAAGGLCWLLPQIKVAGNAPNYLEALWTVLQANAAGTAIGGSWGALTTHLQRAGVFVLVGIGVVRVVSFAIVRLARRDPTAPAEAGDTGLQALPLALWNAPSLWLVWLLPTLAWASIYTLPAAGALLALWPPLCVLGALAFRVPQGRWTRGFAAAAIVLDVVLFFVVPVSDLSGPARAVFGGADFFHERTRETLAAAEIDSLRNGEVDLGKTLVLAHEARQRALAYVAPEMYVLHGEPQRPQTWLIYHGRRARALQDTYEVPQEVRWLVVDDAETFSRAHNPLLGPAWRRETRAGTNIIHVGHGPVDAWFVPRRASAIASRIRLTRGLPPADPSNAALERAELNP